MWGKKNIIKIDNDILHFIFNENVKYNNNKTYYIDLNYGDCILENKG